MYKNQLYKQVDKDWKQVKECWCNRW